MSSWLPLLLSLVAVLLWIQVKGEPVGAQAALHPRPEMNADDGIRPPGRRPMSKLFYDFSPCASDIARLCTDVETFTDFSLLQCLHNAGARYDTVSTSCQQHIWQIKLNVTMDSQFAIAAKKYCARELEMFPDCVQTRGNLVDVRAHLLNCMLDKKSKITNQECLSFLGQVEVFTFSDFRLVGRFVLACRDDVVKYNCGQLSDTRDPNEIHSQGSTLDCLMRKYMENPQEKGRISEQCRHEMLRIAELQSDDFHLDRPLYFACRDDRERFCRDIRAGEGRVIQCLMMHRGERGMSNECSAALLQREKMVAADYKASYPLVTACKADIEKIGCMIESNDHPEYMLLSYVLLCLENAIHMGRQIDKDCENQLTEHRKMLFSDYRLEPELVLSCSSDIEKFCQDVMADGSKVLHCLMKVVQTRFKEMQPSCYQSVAKAVKVADISRNYKVDSVLYNDCRAIIEGPCRSEVTSETQMLSCLMSHLDTPELPEECENRLLEVQFFLARDFTLDSQLYDACHSDAVQKCSAMENWAQQGARSGAPAGPDPGQLVLICLYRHAYVDDSRNQLSPKCTAEVRRVMRERAISVRLMPAIAEACFADLSDKCSQKTAVGEELMCLQEKYQELEPTCQDAVQRFTMLQSRDYRLNQALTKACRAVIKTYCQSFAQEELDNGDMLDCLLQHKGAPEMTHKCRAYVAHTELISMKDFRFTFKFRQACRSDVEQHCLAKSPNDKASIVRCLSEIMIVHLMLGEGPELKKECRKQLRAEYFKMETADQFLDPDMMQVCKADISKHGCHSFSTNLLVEECLKGHKNDLEPLCRKYIFRKEKLEFADNTFDFMLQKVCAFEIHQLCANVDKEHVFRCLKSHKDEPSISGECARLIDQRQHEQASDVRLQPVLFTACSNEIQRLCQHEYSALKSQPDDDAHGRVLSCLRRWITEKNEVAISDQCKREVKQVIFATEVDPTLDIPFHTSCKAEIDRLCSESYLMNKGGHRGILECMKARYMENRIVDAGCKQELVRIMKEELADIHLDVMLYQACVMDIKHYCNDVTPGDGKVLVCLLSAAQSSNVHLSDECRSKLSDRKTLWGKATRERRDMKPPENVVEFAQFVAGSPARTSIMSIVLLVLLCFFICGICCGRASRRLKREMKNR
ncbi:cysteine rich repeat-containing domain protein [Trichuris suis]|nr:cysteine rich repeat-containing domain protein [Trichuris suis]